MNTKKVLSAAIAAALLSGCGSSNDEPLKANWKGGLYAVYESTCADTKGLMILHHGHAPFEGNEPKESLKPTALNFADKCFTVYAMEMPPPDTGPGGHTHGPIELFTDPVHKLIDSLESSGKPIYMAGVSGGAWTTALMTYRDPRIVKGYAVSGAHPGLSHTGDWEQAHFTQDEYWQMYHASADRIVYIFNYYDPCCWGGISGDQGFPYVSDTTHRLHTISPWAVDYIVADIGK